MGRPVYRYNPKTCRYERQGLTFGKISTYAATLIFLTMVFFAGILAMQYFFVPTQKEVTLRKENMSLKENRKVLHAEIMEAEGLLSNLREQDEQIQRSLFPASAKAPVAVAPEQPDSLLAVSPHQFFAATRNIGRTLDSLLKKSSAYDRYFSSKLNLSPDQLQMLTQIPTIQPLENSDVERLISGFGMRINPFYKGNYEHPGVDFAAPRGTAVFATADGVVVNVVHSTLEAGYGNYIDVSHANGFLTRYAHLEDITVREGQRVKKGSTIGTVGSSGGSIAPHVHYEIYRDGDRVDPVNYIIEGLTSDQYDRLRELAERQNQSLD